MRCSALVGTDHTHHLSEVWNSEYLRVTVMSATECDALLLYRRTAQESARRNASASIVHRSSLLLAAPARRPNASPGDQDVGGHDPRQAADGDRRKGALHEGT